jgi:hypothetical protein
MVCETYEYNTNNTSNSLLDMVTEIHKETLNERIRQKRI